MARATHVKRARKDYPKEGIKKGDEYCDEHKAEWLDEKWQEIDSAINNVDEG